MSGTAFTTGSFRRIVIPRLVIVVLGIGDRERKLAENHLNDFISDATLRK